MTNTYKINYRLENNSELFLIVGDRNKVIASEVTLELADNYRNQLVKEYDGMSTSPYHVITIMTPGEVYEGTHENNPPMPESRVSRITKSDITELFGEN